MCFYPLYYKYIAKSYIYCIACLFILLITAIPMDFFNYTQYCLSVASLVSSVAPFVLLYRIHYFRSHMTVYDSFYARRDQNPGLCFYMHHVCGILETLSWSLLWADSRSASLLHWADQESCQDTLSSVTFSCGCSVPRDYVH